MPKTPAQLRYGDSYSLGQLAQTWQKPADFVRGLVNRGQLAVNEQGVVTNAELRRFYQESGTLLD